MCGVVGCSRCVGWWGVVGVWWWCGVVGVWGGVV